MFLAALAAQAQSIVINLESGGTDSYPLAEVRSITFPGGEMRLNLTDGTAVQWPTDQIRSYAFIDLTTGTDLLVTDPLSLRVSPNPSNGSVRITLRGGGGARLRMDLFDMTGRLLEQVYDGAMPTARLDLQYSSSHAAGPCLLRATTDLGITTLPVIIDP